MKVFLSRDCELTLLKARGIRTLNLSVCTHVCAQETFVILSLHVKKSHVVYLRCVKEKKDVDIRCEICKDEPDAPADLVLPKDIPVLDDIQLVTFAPADNTPYLNDSFRHFSILRHYESLLLNEFTTFLEGCSEQMKEDAKGPVSCPYITVDRPVIEFPITSAALKRLLTGHSSTDVVWWSAAVPLHNLSKSGGRMTSGSLNPKLRVQTSIVLNPSREELLHSTISTVTRMKSTQASNEPRIYSLEACLALANGHKKSPPIILMDEKSESWWDRLAPVVESTDMTATNVVLMTLRETDLKSAMDLKLMTDTFRLVLQNGRQKDQNDTLLIVCIDQFATSSSQKEEDASGNSGQSFVPRETPYTLAVQDLRSKKKNKEKSSTSLWRRYMQPSEDATNEPPKQTFAHAVQELIENYAQCGQSNEMYQFKQPCFVFTATPTWKVPEFMQDFAVTVKSQEARLPSTTADNLEQQPVSRCLPMRGTTAEYQCPKPSRWDYKFDIHELIRRDDAKLTPLGSQSLVENTRIEPVTVESLCDAALHYKEARCELWLFEGMGKTTFLAQTAWTCGRAMWLRLGDYLASEVGGLQQSLIRLFATAEAATPVVVFIDDADVFFSTRDQSGEEQSVSTVPLPAYLSACLSARMPACLSV